MGTGALRCHKHNHVARQSLPTLHQQLSFLPCSQSPSRSNSPCQLTQKHSRASILLTIQRLVAGVSACPDILKTRQHCHVKRRWKGIKPWPASARLSHGNGHPVRTSPRTSFSPPPRPPPCIFGYLDLPVTFPNQIKLLAFCSYPRNAALDAWRAHGPLLQAKHFAVWPLRKWTLIKTKPNPAGA